MSLRIAFCFGLTALAAGCTTSPDPSQGPVETPVVAPVATPPTHLGAWYWTGTLAADGHDRAREAERYMLDFQDDGVVLVRADCNRGRASYSLPNRYQLSIGPVGLTKIGCGDDSQDRLFLGQLAKARALGAGAEWMLVDLLDDVGVMHFARSPSANLQAYRCGSGATIYVGYTEGSARLMAAGRVWTLAAVAAGSGARFEAADVVVHSKGNDALISGTGSDDGLCVGT